MFDSNGNVNILGALSQNSELYAGPKDFAIQNSSGGLNLVITNPEGNMSIKGALNQNQPSPLVPTLSAFIIQNKTGQVVAYVNSTGRMCITGALTENVLFS